MAGKIERENDLASKLEQQIGPGVYLSGKKLLATEGSDGKLRLVFEGNWDLLVSGDFKVTLVDKAPVLPDGRKTAEHLAEAGKQIMSGEGLEIEGELVGEEEEA